jgi:phosphoglycolate phosphatase-like HAD superfamily hydrolase
MKLILFDIDGTLLTTDGAGRAALRAAGADVFAIEEISRAWQSREIRTSRLSMKF